MSTNPAATDPTWTVTCEDGQVRHSEPFATRQGAAHFAHWGHCCTARHDIAPTPPPALTPGQQAWLEVEAQGSLQPGQQGWWKVWGATPRHIRPGDLVLIKAPTPRDPENPDANDIETLLVEDLFLAKSAPMRVGVVVNGAQNTIGALCPIVLLRKGNRNTLAD